MKVRSKGLTLQQCVGNMRRFASRRGLTRPQIIVATVLGVTSGFYMYQKPLEQYVINTYGEEALPQNRNKAKRRAKTEAQQTDSDNSA